MLDPRIQHSVGCVEVKACACHLVVRGVLLCDLVSTLTLTLALTLAVTTTTTRVDPASLVNVPLVRRCRFVGRETSTTTTTKASNLGKILEAFASFERRGGHEQTLYCDHLAACGCACVPAASCTNREEARRCVTG